MARPPPRLTPAGATAGEALDADLPPDTISTGIYAASVNGPVFDMPTTMSKMLYLGMSFEEILLRFTANPARIINRAPGMGTLEIGAPADIALLGIEGGNFRASRPRAVSPPPDRFQSRRLPDRMGARCLTYRVLRDSLSTNEPRMTGRNHRKPFLAGSLWARKTASLLLLVFAQMSRPQERLVFTAEANLQSVAVEVTDGQGRDLRGLSAADFTLLEDGQPQKIAFFGAEDQPVSLAVLVDSSASMRSGHKLEQVSEILPPLLRGNLPGDEIYFAQFTDRVFQIQPLTGEERLHPPMRQVESRAGTAFYDAVASALCTMRGARNFRQAVVVITDGADQHSRLTLDQLIHTAQAARPQIFTIGFFDDREAGIFRNSDKVVTLVNSRDIDNPLKAFERISKETGAEAFFPSTRRDLQKAVERILGILHAQYTLAYHTARPGALRRIQVRVNRRGAVVAARGAMRSATEDGATAHFSTTSCEVSATDHPYPWEPHVTRTPDGLTHYHDDFSDPHSGWPVHQGLRYRAGAYEISISPPERSMMSGPRGRGVNSAPVENIGPRVPGEIAAYGPWFTDFQASVEIEPPEDGLGDGGLIFRLNERGYYLLLLQRGEGASDTVHQRGKGASDTVHGGRPIAYKLVKRFWSDPFDEPIMGWTPFRISPLEAAVKPGPQERFVTAFVECKGNRITVRIDGIEAMSLTDEAFADGQVGMGFYGQGHALFRGLKVAGAE